MIKAGKKIIGCIMAAAVVISGIAVPQNADAAKVKVNKITLASNASGNKKKVVVAKGMKVKIKTTVSVRPNKKANKKVTYAVKDKKIAKVNAKGYVTGLKAGNTAVVVTSAADKTKSASINIEVKKNAVTKVTLPKKEENVYIGDKLTLTPTVKGKKTADKTIKYNSKNKKVVKVNKKGVVTTVATGSALVVAKAIDGSGKKASCRINVLDNINIDKVMITNAQTVCFTLDSPYNGLNASNITIKKKSYASGAYRYTCEVESVTTDDGKTYTVVVKEDDAFEEGDIIQVGIPDTLGKNTTKAAVFAKAAATLIYDEFFKYDMSGSAPFNAVLQNKGFGYSTLALTGGTIPPGVEAVYKNGNVEFTGNPTTEGVYTSIFTGTDELGNTNTYNCTILIGSRNKLVACAAPVYSVTGVITRTMLYVCGGNGQYVVTAAGTGFNPVVQSVNNEFGRSDYIECQFETAGTYNAIVTVNDAVNAQCTATTNIAYSIKPAIVVSGNIVDANGAPISNPFPMNGEKNAEKELKIEFINNDRGERHCQTPTEADKIMDANGQFSGGYKASVPAGTYDIVVTYNYGETQAVKRIYGVNIMAGMVGYDIRLPLYNVKLVSSYSADPAINGDWKDMNGKIYAYGSNLYLKQGTYNLGAVWTDYIGTVALTVPAVSQPVTAYVNKVENTEKQTS